jgi:hypothetical protein
MYILSPLHTCHSSSTSYLPIFRKHVLYADNEHTYSTEVYLWILELHYLKFRLFLQFSFMFGDNSIVSYCAIIFAYLFTTCSASHGDHAIYKL